jgi:hypothetical protein
MAENQRQLVLVLPYFNFPIPIEAARQTRVLNAQIDFNLARGNQAEEDWSFSIRPEELSEDLQADPVAQQALQEYLSFLFLNIPLSTTWNERALITALDIIKALECLQPEKQIAQTTLCERSMQLLRFYFQGETSTLPRIDVMLYWLQIIPMETLHFLRKMSNLLYETDSFTLSILNYFRQIIEVNEQYAYALQPHGYPTVRSERIDKFEPSFFLLDPLRRTNPELPDYMGADYVAVIPTNSFTVAPGPVVMPDQALFLRRLLQIFPQLLKFNEEIGALLSQQYPDRSVGCVLTGALFSICLDDWLFQHFNSKTVIELHVYGPTPAIRKDVFGKIQFWFSANFGRQDYKFRQGRQGFDILLLKENVPAFALRILTSDAKSAMQILKGQQVSHLQVGYDLYRGLVCTPLFSLYFRRRLSIIDDFIIEFYKVVTAVFYGFGLQIIAPFAYLSRYTFYAVGYTRREQVGYTHDEASGYSFEDIRDQVLVKGRPKFITRIPGAAGVPQILSADTIGPRYNPHTEILGESGGYQVIGDDNRVDSLILERWDTPARAAGWSDETIDFSLSPELKVPPHLTTIEGLGDLPRGFYGTHELRTSFVDAGVMQSNFGLASLFLLRQCRFQFSESYSFPNGITIRTRNGRNRLAKPPAGYLSTVSTIPTNRFPSEQDLATETNLVKEVVRYPNLPAQQENPPEDQPEQILYSLPAPLPLEHPELLRSPYNYYPITVTGVLQLRTDNRIRPILIGEMRDPIDLSDEEIQALPLVQAEQLYDLLLAADPFFNAQVMAYREVNSDNRAMERAAEAGMGLGGANVPTRGEMERIRGTYDRAVIKYSKQTPQLAAQLPKYVRVQLNVLITRWLFIDEGQWIMPPEDILKYEFNCALRKNSENIITKKAGAQIELLRCYKIFP